MNDTLAITSPRYWRFAGRVATWSRWAGATSVAAFVFLVVHALVLAARGGQGAGPYLADVTSTAAWAAAFLIPAWIILRRLERAAAKYEAAGTP
jgi:hypothetical protein